MHGHRRLALGGLAAGHRHGVVEQQLVGHAGLRRDRLADRQDAGMLVGAVADIGEHVLDVGEAGQADEGRALAAHLGEGAGVRSPSSSAMKWQPMPALAKLPSGSLVEVACGQPAQNAGMRRSRPSGRSTASGAGSAGQVQPGPAEERADAGGDALRRQFHQRRQQRRAAAGRSCR